MDELGVFVKSYGIKPQGKSSPMAMASSKTTPKPAHNKNLIHPDPSPFGPYSARPINHDNIFGFNSTNTNTSDDVFNVPAKNGGGSGGGGGGFDIESMFKRSMNLNSKIDGDMIWGFSGNVVSGSSDDLLSYDPVDDFFGKIGSNPTSSNVGGNTDGDLLPGFGVRTAQYHRAQAGSREKSAGSSSLEELEDFVTGGVKTTSKGRLHGFPAPKEAKQTGSPLDELEDFVTGGAKKTSRGHLHGFPAPKEAKQTGSSLDELEDFVTGGVKKTSKGHLHGFPAPKEAKQTGSSLDELEDFVTSGTKKTAKGHLNGFSATKEAKQSGSSLDDFDDFVTGGMKKTDKGHLSGNSSKKQAKKTVSQKSQQTNFIDIEGCFNDDSVHKDKLENVSDLLFPEEATDLDTFFGAHTKKSVPVSEDISMNTQADGVPDMFSETLFRMETTVPPSGFPDGFSSIFEGASTSAVFEEIEGESEERRRARLGRHQRASARMAQALAEMNEREYQAQQEREEKHRLADAMDVEMKQWAAGKEGNLRALLSSLQQVLAPELGWRPVTLTDLITSSQVKIAYKKAALCVHPDKVQQKGASLEQKFVAEKVFDLLKEAWNKFNAEELR